jgi:hypothetical protein
MEREANLMHFYSLIKQKNIKYYLINGVREIDKKYDVKEIDLIMAKKKTHEQFIKEVQDKFGDVYNFLEEYKRYDDKIQVQHKCEDGEWYTWGISPANLLHGKGLCPKCSDRSTGTDEYIRKVRKKFGDEYLVLGEFTGSWEFISLKHNIEGCHHEFITKARQFLCQGTRCPPCSPFSRGEDCIKQNLIKNLMYYKPQKTFKDCIFKQMLRFDFAVFTDKEKTNIKYLIEYQGEQHYKPQRFHGMSVEKAEHTFEETIIKDKIKVDYCLDNNIKFLIIPYWDFKNIDEILNDIDYYIELNTTIQEQ